MIFDKTQIKSAKYALYTFIILVVLQLIMIFGIFNPSFFTQYAWWFLYLDITIVTIGAGIHYMLSYKAKAPCMTGMMIGMTIGMQTGMMLGAVIGATNGFFTGAMVGMILGSVSGIMAGKISNTSMSWLQGLMAGIMGGTMGPMISLMMFTDHILTFMPFYFILNVIVLWGFMRMYHEELIVDNNEHSHRNVDFMTFASISIIAAFIMTIVMIYGPKSPLFV